MESKIDEHGIHKKRIQANHFIQNAQSVPISGRVPQQMPASATTTASLSATAVNNALPRHIRRVPVPMSYLAAPSGGSMYGGGYNAYNPYNRSYMNMNMGGGYSPYSSYGQSMTNQYQNPVVQAAAEHSRPAFESIQSVVQTFNAVSMMLDSLLTAMQMSFQAFLGVAENFARMKLFMGKLYSTIVSFKLARWFLTKLIYLIRMVKGGRGTNFEEDLWSSLSSTAQGEVVPSDGLSWPLVVFTGIIVTAPYFLHKLLNAVVPMPNSDAPTNNTNEFVIQSASSWNSVNPKTIPLVKGQNYWTSHSHIHRCLQNGGWLYVRNANGQKGFVPIKLLQHHPRTDHVRTLPTLSEEDPNVIREVVEVPTVPQQIGPQVVETPVTDANGSPIILPHSPLVIDPLEDDVQ